MFAAPFLSLPHRLLSFSIVIFRGRVAQHKNLSVFPKIFGTNDVGEQKGIMNAITSHIWTGTSYVFLDGIDDKRNYIWLNEATIKDHTCAKCKKIVRKLTQYGKEQYCASCLQEIHAQEDADEAEGKAVKRYISAPPPGVKIKM